MSAEDAAMQEVEGGMNPATTVSVRARMAWCLHTGSAARNCVVLCARGSMGMSSASFRPPLAQLSSGNSDTRQARHGET